MAGGDGGYGSHNFNAYAPSAESSVMMEDADVAQPQMHCRGQSSNYPRLRRDSCSGANARKPLFRPSSSVVRDVIREDRHVAPFFRRSWPWMTTGAQPATDTVSLEKMVDPWLRIEGQRSWVTTIPKRGWCRVNQPHDPARCDDASFTPSQQPGTRVLVNPGVVIGCSNLSPHLFLNGAQSLESASGQTGPGAEG
jgi:hypothetical protein